MTLLQLKYFCTACDLCSVTKAAEKLFVTQPTITSAIRELEKEYHLQLLDRRGKGMNLTEKGRLFYQNAAVMLHCADDFDRRMHEMAELRRYVRLGLTKASGSSVYT